MAKGKTPIEEMTFKELLKNLNLKSSVWFLGLLTALIIGTSTISYKLGTRHFFDKGNNHQNTPLYQSKDTSSKKEVLNIKSPTVTNTIDSSSNVDNSIIVGDNNDISK